MPGAKDRNVLDRAQADARLLVTFDKDFHLCRQVHRAPYVAAGIVGRQALRIRRGDRDP